MIKKFNEYSINESVSVDSIIQSLMSLDNDTKRSLGVNSADPVYENPKIRKSWMIQIQDGLKHIGLSEIKSNWEKIHSELKNENYHQLNLFLTLAIKINKKEVTKYQNNIDSYSDKEAIADFLSVDL
jgi:antirestriction protein